MIMSKSNNYISNSLKRGLDILRLFDEENVTLSLSEVSQKLGVSRTVPYRLMYTLKEEGYLEQDSITKRYQLTPKVLSLGYSYINSFKLPELLQPFLEEIRDDLQASCYLSVLNEKDVVYVGSAPMKELTGINVSVGTRIPAHATANGKLLLAYQPIDKIKKMYSTEEFRKFTNYTFSSREQLINELLLIKEKGYAKTDKEFLDFISSVAVPIFDNTYSVSAAINVVVPNTSFDESFLMEVALPKLLAISAQLNEYGGWKRFAY